MLKRFGFLGLALWTASFGCGRSQDSSKSSTLSKIELREKSLRFAAETNLIGATGAETGLSRGAFSPSLFTPLGYSPASQLVLPARGAVFLQEAYGTPSGFTFQTFDFVSSSCSDQNAFGRYFASIELLRGQRLSQAERDLLRQNFRTIFTSDSATSSGDICIFYDLITCIAEFTVQNVDQFRQVLQTGDYSVIFTGALSCVGEVLGSTVDTTETR